MDSMRRALQGYNTIRNYCLTYKLKHGSSCDGCLFQMDDTAPEECIFEFDEFPRDWQELELPE